MNKFSIFFFTFLFGSVRVHMQWTWVL